MLSQSVLLRADRENGMHTHTCIHTYIHTYIHTVHTFNTMYYQTIAGVDLLDRRSADIARAVVQADIEPRVAGD